MKNKRTYKIIKLNEPKVSWNEIRSYGIEIYIGGILKKVIGQDNFYDAFQSEESAQKYIDDIDAEYGKPFAKTEVLLNGDKHLEDIF